MTPANDRVLYAPAVTVSSLTEVGGCTLDASYYGMEVRHEVTHTYTPPGRWRALKSGSHIRLCL